jgi:hypothetical protein
MVLAVSVKTTIYPRIIISHAMRIKLCPIVQVTGLEVKAKYRPVAFLCHKKLEVKSFASLRDS